MKRFNESWDFASGEVEQPRDKKTVSQIADAIMRTVSLVEEEKDPAKTYWVELGWDDANTYACAMAYDNENDYDEEGEVYPYVLAKIAFCPDNSAMNEYEMDWLMPYDEETGEVWDTETSITTYSDAEWLAEEWLAIMDRINKSAGYEQLVDDDLYEGLFNKKKSNKKYIVDIDHGGDKRSYGTFNSYDDACEYIDRVLPNNSDYDKYITISEGCHGGKKKKSKKKVLNQKKVCGEDAKRTKNGYTFFIDDNAEPEVVRKGLVDYTLDGYVDMGDFDAPCKIGFYDGEDEPVYIFVDDGVTDDGYHYEKDTIALESYVRESSLKKVQLSPSDLSDRAFDVYSNSTFTIQVDNQGDYYVDGKVVGDIDSLNAYLEEISELDESYVREERMYDLAPQKRDSRKSFYGKAKVVDKGNGEYELISYNTPVACVKDGKVVYADLRKYSATTDRHIREFLAQFCDEC